MTEPIISRATIRAKAATAFHAGKPRDAHNMNPGASALTTWLSEYDRLVSIHSTAANGERVELAQGGQP